MEGADCWGAGGLAAAAAAVAEGWGGGATEPGAAEVSILSS